MLEPIEVDISQGASSYNRSSDDQIRGYERIIEPVRRVYLERTHVTADWPTAKRECVKHGYPTIREDGECYVEAFYTDMGGES